MTLDNVSVICKLSPYLSVQNALLIAFTCFRCFGKLLNLVGTVPCFSLTFCSVLSISLSLKWSEQITAELLGDHPSRRMFFIH